MKPPSPPNVDSPVRGVSGLQTTDYLMGPETKVWWATPILRRKWDGFEAVSDGLKTLVLERARSGQNQNDNKGSQSSWYSDQDLLSCGGPAVAQLQDWIVTGFQELTSVTSGGKSYRGKLDISAWADIKRNGDYNAMNTNPACVWSGVYHVDAGDPPPKDRPKSGAIEFLDPRVGAEMIVTPGAPFGQPKVFTPRAGEMIMFPSWLKYMVHPYWGERDRISIVFNVRLRPNP